MTKVQSRLYRNGRLAAEGFTIDQVSELLGQDDTMLWIDLCGPSKEELDQLGDELGLHELAVEDALDEHQRPKLDHYASHLFLATHAVYVDLESGRLSHTEIDTFVNARWMVTVRRDDRFFMGAVLQRWDRSPDLAAYGVSFLLYGLLDVIVDGYFDAVESFDEYYDAISESIFSEHPLDPARQRHWFQMRQSLVRFHRLVVPLREAISSLMRREHTAVAEQMYPYYQDVYDHILRVSEASDALRDLVATIVETNISLRDYRQNQIMKKVTSWAAIVAVPTLITGWYGMNVPYPGFARHSGVAVASLLMVAMSGALYVLFRRKDWL